MEMPQWFANQVLAFMGGGSKAFALFKIKKLSFLKSVHKFF